MFKYPWGSPCTSASTYTALVRLSLVLASAPAAHTADDVLCAREFGRLALVQLLERDFVVLHFTWRLPAFFGPAAGSHSRHASHASHASHTTHSAHEHIQDVVHIHFSAHATGPFATVKCRHAMCVVEMSFIVIVEDLVRFLNSLETNFRSRSLIFGGFVWMVGKSSLHASVRTFPRQSMAQGGRWKVMQSSKALRTLRYAFLISSFPAELSTPSTSVNVS